MSELNMSTEGLLAFMRGATDEDLLALGDQKLSQCFAAYAEHYDIPHDRMKGQLRLMDMSKLPERFRPFFDTNGLLKSVASVA